MRDEILERYLDKQGIKYKSVKHKAVFTVEESKKHRALFDKRCMHCKTLFLRDENAKFYLIGMNAYKRLNIKNLEKHLKVKKLRFASEDDLLRELRLKPGSVSIFGIIHSRNSMLIIDREVWNAEIVGFHPNLNTETLELNHDGLERFYSSLPNKKEVVII